MGDIKLFNLESGKATEIAVGSLGLEKSLQILIETNLETLLGIRFLSTEHSTGNKHPGRIDTLGIDENGFPVIIEYKLKLDQNVITQGLFYLSWLLDHKADFKLLVLEKYGKEVSNSIAWSGTRLICIAQTFARYDESAIAHFGHNIELIRYQNYGQEMLLLELVNVVRGSSSTSTSISEILVGLTPTLSILWDALKQFALTLGEDVQIKELKLYWAYKRLKNFMCAEVRATRGVVVLFLSLDPESVEIENGFTRDVRNIGHWGTGGFEVTLRSLDDLERSKPLIVKSYEGS